MAFKWGIIGPGRIAGKFADAVGACDETHVEAVASRSLDRATSFADQFGAERSLGSYEELAALAEVDAVYIATPHRFHFEQAMLCLEAGKHVVCEKPITVNAAECELLVRKSMEKGLFLMEALWTRFLPIYQEVRSWIEEDVIGPPSILNSTFCFVNTPDRPDRLWRHDLAGGALLDIGVYNIAVSQFLLGREPTSILVEGHLNEHRVDDQICATLIYKGDDEAAAPAVSQFTCSFLSSGPNDFHVSGPGGAIQIHNRFWGATKATLRREGRPELTVDAPHRHNGFEYQIEAAIQCIRTGKHECETMSHGDSLANMQLMDQIRAAIGLRYDFEND